MMSAFYSGNVAGRMEHVSYRSHTSCSVVYSLERVAVTAGTSQGAASQVETYADWASVLTPPQGVYLSLTGFLWFFLQKPLLCCVTGISASLAGSFRQGTCCASGPLHLLFPICQHCVFCSVTTFWSLLKALSSSENFRHHSV